MIDPEAFARKQTELAAEFAKYVLENPGIDQILPEDSYIYFELEGEPDFNRYGRDLAERREQEEGVSAVCVRVRGLAPRQGSRLIDPRIDATPNFA